MEKNTEQRQATGSVLECPQQTEYPNQDKYVKVLWKCHQIEQVQNVSTFTAAQFSGTIKREFSGLQASTNSKQFYF